MASIFRRKEKTHPGDMVVEFKQTGTDSGGNPVYAEVLALEPGSIGGGGTGSAVTVADGSDVAQGTTSDAAWVTGSGTVISLLKKIASAGGSAVSVADGADAAQGTTTDLSSANTVIGILKAIKAAITGTLTTNATVSNFPATQAVSLSTNTPDVTDRAARLLGHVTVDNASIPVTGSFFPGTQPVSIAATVAVSGPLTDTQLRAAAVPVSGAFFQTTQPVSIAATVAVSGPLTDTQLRAAAVPVSIATMPSTPVTGTFFQATQPVSGAFFQATQPVSIAATVAISAAALPLPTGAATSANQSAVKAASTLAAATDTSQVVAQSPMRADASTLAVTATGLTGAAVTASLPAPAAGLFHYITMISFRLTATTARTGTAPVIVTSTNLPGSPAWDFDTSQAVGVTIRENIVPATPIKSLVAATITTIVAPVATTGLWRITVHYYTAP